MSSALDQTLQAIKPVNSKAMEKARARQDQLTKPQGSLGGLEGLSVKLAGNLIAAHVSAEAGHRALLRYLDLQPLLDLRMRLGEGTGAALGIFLSKAAARIL